MTDLKALVERIEGAAKNDADLFREVATAVFGSVPDVMNRFLAAGAYLDAAMQLVPEGWYWRAGSGVLWPGWAHLNRKHPDHCDYDDEHSAHAATPALALCAASLRARISKGTHP